MSDYVTLALSKARIDELRAEADHERLARKVMRTSTGRDQRRPWVHLLGGALGAVRSWWSPTRAPKSSSKCRVPVAR